jgi:hypothetical protein
MSRNISILLLWGIAFVALCASAQQAANVSKGLGPQVSLTIAECKIKMTGDPVQPLIVTEKNITNHEIDVSRSSDQSTWYKVEILRNGIPVPKTEELRRREAPHKNFDNLPSPLFLQLKPGEEQALYFPIATFYEMREPGEYQITLMTRAHDDTVPAKSNTITITVAAEPDPAARH